MDNLIAKLKSAAEGSREIEQLEAQVQAWEVRVAELNEELSKACWFLQWHRDELRDRRTDLKARAQQEMKS